MSASAVKTENSSMDTRALNAAQNWMDAKNVLIKTLVHPVMKMNLGINHPKRENARVKILFIIKMSLARYVLLTFLTVKTVKMGKSVHFAGMKVTLMPRLKRENAFVKRHFG